MKADKVVVTGGAGFIGSHLVDSLIGAGYEVHIIDNLSTGKSGHINDSAIFHKVDIRSFGDIVDIFKGAVCVFHLAAIASVVESVENPFYTHDVNVNGTFNVLEASKMTSVKRVVFASSAAVYGSEPNFPTKESEAYDAKSPYALHKIIGEQYMSLYNSLFGVETVSLRFFNVYGSRQDPSSPYSGVISIFIDRAQDDKSILIDGDGKQTRDFVNVSDVVRAIILAKETVGINNEVFNIGTGKSVSINELARVVCGALNNDVEIKYTSGRKGDVRDSVANICKAKDILNWEPTVKIVDGIKKMFC